MTTSVTQPKAKKLTRWKKVAIAVPLLWAGLISAARAVELDVGVVQRFGEEADDEVVLKAVDGDRLTISFRDPKSPNQMRNLITDAIKLTVKSEPLPEPKLREIVILGTFRSFETAEEAANRWRSRGIAVEIAQPSNRWQVWGDRDTYDDPLARRMLLESIQQIQDNTNNSEDSVALDSRMVRSRPDRKSVV